MITLSKKDVGQKFRNAKGEVLTLTKWLDDDPEFPARLGDDGRNYNANGHRILHLEERDTLVARVEENPPCLKTRLRTREIGRKFKCRGGAIATLKYRHGSRPGVWVGTGPGPTEMLWEANGRTCRDAGASSWDLVERLPVEKAAKPAPKFKVGDRVVVGVFPNHPEYDKDLNFCSTMETYNGAAGVITDVYDRNASYRIAEPRYRVHGWWWPERAVTLVKRCPYPDYKKMKAALEDIRDNSPIGSDAAQWAKDALEPEYVS